MTNECMYVEERLEYGRAHLVLSSRRAGKDVRSKVVVKISLRFTGLAAFPFSVRSFGTSRDGETQANPSHLRLSLPFKVYLTFNFALKCVQTAD